MSYSPVLAQDIELSRFRNSAESVARYVDGKNQLIKSGIINFLRIFSRPFTMDRGANPYTAAYTAAYTEGYNKALDDIVYFEEMYLVEEVRHKPVQANFGGLGIALVKGDLTERDLNGKR